jgi:hypothetical protein
MTKRIGASRRLHGRVSAGSLERSPPKTDSSTVTKKNGQSAGMEKSPERRKREAQRRRMQEKRWAARSGPVTVRRVGDPKPSTDDGEVPSADA